MSLAQAQEPTQEDVQTAQNVNQLWSQGNQSAAIDALRPTADNGEPWAVNLICWMTMQMGYPGIETGIPYANRAIDLGMPWSVANFLANLVANVPAAPHLFDKTIELMAKLLPWQSGVDTAGHGWNLISQGHVTAGIKMMGLRMLTPHSDGQWSSMATSAREHADEIARAVSDIRSRRESVDNIADEVAEAIAKSREDLETSAQHAGLLVTSVTADATRSLFDEDAKRNEGDSKTAWKWGLVVLVFAAFVAVLPLGLHYAGKGPGFTRGALIAAHATATAAFATVAGVLLARARSRDLARQRANDLSTAMGTMIAYSNQIKNDVEKERFMMTMGQVVLQAHLTAGGGSGSTGHDESLSGLLALANLIRQPTPPAQAKD